MGKAPCSRLECDRDRASKLGLCNFHLYRLLNGIPLGAPLSTSGSSGRVVMKECSYVAAHKRCRRLWGSPSQYDCAHGCGERAREWSYDGTDPLELCGPDGSKNPGRVYSRFPEFYMPLCRNCHTEMDKVWRRQLQEQFKEFQQWKTSVATARRLALAS